MRKALSFIRLDLLTIRPYLTVKNLMLFIGIALVMHVSSGTNAGAIGIFMGYAALYVSYPFAVGEQNGIDALYVTLSIGRNTVVLGRYLFALIVDLCSALLSFVLAFAVSVALKRDFGALQSLLTTCVILLAYSALQSIQLPIFFKLGYTRAKLLAYLPFVVLPLAVILFSSLFKGAFAVERAAYFFGWLAANPLMAAVLGGVLWTGMMLASYKTSLFYYGKRDF